MCSTVQTTYIIYAPLKALDMKQFKLIYSLYLRHFLLLTVNYVLGRNKGGQGSQDGRRGPFFQYLILLPKYSVEFNLGIIDCGQIIRVSASVLIR